MTEQSKIFNPQAKVYANADRVLDFLDDKNPAPVLVEFDPSNTCNHGCYFCISSYIHLPESKDLDTYDKTVMPRDVLMAACSDFVDMGVRAINWTGGGEPTINRHLKEAIQYIGDKSDIKMGIFTNGTLLDKWDMFDTMVDNMTWVRFSVDAGTPETYNSIRRAKSNQGWDKMTANLTKLIEVNNSKDKKIQIGTGFVITPDTYKEITNFAEYFSQFDIDYCQYKPEVVNREREEGVQRDLDFWKTEVEPRLDEAKKILGDKFQINGYKLTDLINDRSLYGRNYKKCLGSQIQPCVGADGEVYVCTNHRGYKQYSYGSLHNKSFKLVWEDIQKRKAVMHQIESVECFKNCTHLCKPHESNKAVWDMHEDYMPLDEDGKAKLKEKLLADAVDIKQDIIHSEFI
jgi:cyclic pyranopterin phosphate synthase|tara:strand:- start:2756 stop:3961 length:1206 start_codon:yes stop_codon:yes gene_type:complete